LEQKLLGHWILFALGGFVSLQTDPRESVTPYDYDYDYDCDYDYDYDYTYCRGLLPGHSLPFPRPLPSSLACRQVVGNWNRNSWDIGSSLRSGGFVSLFSNSFSSNT